MRTLPLLPYLGQGEGCLSAGAALNSELSRLDLVAGAFAVDEKAVVGRFNCRGKAETVPNQCEPRLSQDAIYESLLEASQLHGNIL